MLALSASLSLLFENKLWLLFAILLMDAWVVLNSMPRTPKFDNSDVEASVHAESPSKASEPVVLDTVL
ncbi:hypothetical protein VNO77_18905 [Canavalia gladiata]|uniref:Uncharacterized protein n=1 Tax=Canavalia gladiata TaxID=3824 RepID=A0AAN9QI26_CANGL